MSPLLLNLYLDHVLDRKWQRSYGHIPLIRYADDILLLCTSQAQAGEAYAAIVALLRPTGMRIKESVDVGVRALTPGNAVEWMGYAIRRCSTGLRLSMAARAWNSLAESLKLAQEAPDAPIIANAVIEGWISQQGPCYPSLNMKRTYDRISGLANEEAFVEIRTRRATSNQWKKAYETWQEVKSNVLQRMGSPDAGCDDEDDE